MTFIKFGEPQDTSNLDKDESCSILIGKIFPFSEKRNYFFAVEKNIDFKGEPFEVNFNYKDVYTLEDVGYPIAGFYHTHPFQNDEACFSTIDERAMKGWCKAFGRYLLCVIANSKDSPKVFIFNKEGFLCTGTILSSDFLDTSKVIRIFYGYF